MSLRILPEAVLLGKIDLAVRRYYDRGRPQESVREVICALRELDANYPYEGYLKIVRDNCMRFIDGPEDKFMDSVSTFCFTLNPSSSTR